MAAEKIVVIQSVMAEDYQVVLVVLLEEVKLQEEILVKKHQVNDVVKAVMGYPEGTRFAIFAPVILPEERTMKSQSGTVI